MRGRQRRRGFEKGEEVREREERRKSEGRTKG